MLGLGKLLGKALDSIGLGWLGDVVSMGINFMSGNWLGLIGDFSNLVNRFRDPSLTERVDREPPLGPFAQNNRRARPSQLTLTSQRLYEIENRLTSDDNGARQIRGGLNRFMRALAFLNDAMTNQESVHLSRHRTYFDGARV